MSNKKTTTYLAASAAIGLLAAVGYHALSTPQTLRVDANINMRDLSYSVMPVSQEFPVTSTSPWTSYTSQREEVPELSNLKPERTSSSFDTLANPINHRTLASPDSFGYAAEFNRFNLISLDHPASESVPSSPVPEPTSLTLLGLSGWALLRRSRRSVK
ncbi:MAG: PEP-CTERM sorting domain-containing protein [Phycisphaerales bacterium]|nr:PEP-CTERM sorting domain-containing protein [Phycisphaerales bacterium]